MNTNVKEWLNERFTRPFIKASNALVIHGDSGTGKSVAAALIAREMESGRTWFTGPHGFKRILQSRAIEYCHIAIVDDIQTNDVEKIKSLISNRFALIELLGEEPYSAAFNVNFVLTTRDTLPESRRFICATPMEVFATIANLPRGDAR